VLFATAVEDGLLRHNPAASVRLPAGGTAEATEPQRKALTEDELAALLSACMPEWQLLVLFLADTGLRIGEALALTWHHVDFGRGRVLVRRRVYEGEYAPPKSRYGRRDVPLAAGLAQQLWARRAEARGHDDEPVFAGRGGEPVDASTAFRAIKAAARRAGVPWAGLHTLRHTCATRLFKAGLNAKQVQVWLGHHSPAFTLSTYVHLLDDDLPQSPFEPSWRDHNRPEIMHRDANTTLGDRTRRAS
jgi:integrase